MCRLGTKDVKTRRITKYCKKIAGYSGGYLVGGAQVSGKQPLSDDFLNCRYFGHSLQNIILDLADDDVLLADGSTVGGCVKYEGWADDKCPKQDMALGAAVAAAVVLIPIIIVVAVVCLICAVVGCVVKRKRDASKSQHEVAQAT